MTLCERFMNCLTITLLGGGNLVIRILGNYILKFTFLKCLNSEQNIVCRKLTLNIPVEVGLTVIRLIGGLLPDGAWRVPAPDL